MQIKGQSMLLPFSCLLSSVIPALSNHLPISTSLPRVSATVQTIRAQNWLFLDDSDVLHKSTGVDPLRHVRIVDWHDFLHIIW